MEVSGATHARVEMDERGLLIECPGCGQRNRLLYNRLDQEFRCGKCQATLRAQGEPVDVQSESLFNSAIAEASIPVLVDFWAPWCGPCKMVAPEVTKVAAETAGRLLVLKVNTEELQSLAQRFEISGIPTFALFQSGREVTRQPGAMSAPQLLRFVQSAIR